MIRVIMHGYRGRMGQAICALIKKTDDCEIVAGIDKELGSNSETFPIFNHITTCDMPADVIIDFSTASATGELIDYAVDKKIGIVLCTTGLDEEISAKINEASKTIPIFKSYNMSLGINLIASILQRIAPILYDEKFDIEIVEKHHNVKIDAPSGTAYFLAEKINNSLDEKLEYVYDRHQKRESRNKNEIGIHAVRGGTIVGEHEVIFAGLDEVIELKHQAYSKEVFAVGAVKAAKFLKDKKAGLFSMDDLMQEYL